MRACDRCPGKEPVAVILQVFVNDGSTNEGLGCCKPLELCADCARIIGRNIDLEWTEDVPFSPDY